MEQPTFEFLSEALGNLFSNLKKEVKELKEENEQLQRANSELERDNENYQDNWIDAGSIETIDFGYGEVEYKKPDNVKLQIVMEEFKEKIEHNTFHTA